MILRLISFIILGALAALFVLILVVNRQSVDFSLDPFGTIPMLQFSAPLPLQWMAMLMIGVLLGGIGAYLSQTHHRSAASKRKKEIDRLKRENAEQADALKRLREDRVQQATNSSNAPGLAAPLPSHAKALPAPRAA